MYKYFEMLKEYANIDNVKYSIKDLTIKLALDAGYQRKEYTFDVGTTRIRTFYDKPFDGVLTAKWLCFYKKLFISKLRTHPELEDFHTYIINDTFYRFMESVDIDKLTSDKVVSKYVNMVLCHRLGQAMYYHGSFIRLDDYNNTSNRKFMLKTALSYNHGYIDELNADSIITQNEIERDCIVLDLKSCLKDNKYGLRLLESMMTSKKKIQLNHIDDFVLIDKDDFNENTKQSILSAYNLIKKTLRSNLSKKLRLEYDWDDAKKISFSFEGDN